MKRFGKYLKIKQVFGIVLLSFGVLTLGIAKAEEVSMGNSATALTEYNQQYDHEKDKTFNTPKIQTKIWLSAQKYYEPTEVTDYINEKMKAIEKQFQNTNTSSASIETRIGGSYPGLSGRPDMGIDIFYMMQDYIGLGGRIGNYMLFRRYTFEGIAQLPGHNRSNVSMTYGFHFIPVMIGINIVNPEPTGFTYGGALFVGPAFVNAEAEYLWSYSSYYNNIILKENNTSLGVGIAAEISAIVGWKFWKNSGLFVEGSYQHINAESEFVMPITVTDTMFTFGQEYEHKKLNINLSGFDIKMGFIINFL